MRLCDLVARMKLEEAGGHPRVVPSSYTLLKAEFGYKGSRSEVWAAALLDAQKGVMDEYLVYQVP